MQPLRVVQITLHLSGLLSFGRDDPVADAFGPAESDYGGDFRNFETIRGLPKD